jgi:hypothetical protein
LSAMVDDFTILPALRVITQVRFTGVAWPYLCRDADRCGGWQAPCPRLRGMDGEAGLRAARSGHVQVGRGLVIAGVTSS